MRDFKLGYAPPGWSSLRAFAESKGIEADALVGCGLAVKNEEGSVYDRFRDRVIFSLIDLSGKVVGFAGRGLDKDAVPKYLNSPETPLYRKKEFLYGLNVTRQYIKDEKCALVVEGYMDFLTLYQAGIRNAVATSGTAMTPSTPTCSTVSPRGSSWYSTATTAGQTAAERGIFTLAPFDLDVAILTLPPRRTLIPSSRSPAAEAFRALMRRRRNASDFIIDRAIAENGGRTPRGQKTVIGASSPLCGRCPRSREEHASGGSWPTGSGSTRRRSVRYCARRAPAARGAARAADNGNDFHAIAPGWKFLHLLVHRPELIAEARATSLPTFFGRGSLRVIFAGTLNTMIAHGNLNGIIMRRRIRKRSSSCHPCLPCRRLKRTCSQSSCSRSFTSRRNFLNRASRETVCS